MSASLPERLCSELFFVFLFYEWGFIPQCRVLKTGRLRAVICLCSSEYVCSCVCMKNKPFKVHCVCSHRLLVHTVNCVVHHCSQDCIRSAPHYNRFLDIGQSDKSACQPAHIAKLFSKIEETLQYVMARLGCPRQGHSLEKKFKQRRSNNLTAGRVSWLQVSSVKASSCFLFHVQLMYLSQ